MAARLTPLLVVAVAVGLVRAQPDEPAVPEVPQVGRPENFSGASGSFRVEADVEPDVVRVEEPLWLILTVTATGPVVLPPERIPLNQVEELHRDFYVEAVRPRVPPQAARAAVLVGQLAGPRNVGLVAATAGLTQETSWEFVYKLRPKNEGVKEVPGVPFCFHNPRIPSAARSFQTQYTDAIPIQVRPPAVYEVPIQADERFFTLAAGDRLLSRWSAPGLPPVPVLACLALLPPVGCVLWYLLWRRLYPDAARLARLRRSRAARVALAALERAGRLSPREQADLVANTVAGYLHQRLDLPVAEPTPQETAGWLEGLGCPAPVSLRARDFFRACDAARFQPSTPGGNGELTRAATELILALEDPAWVAHG